VLVEKGDSKYILYVLPVSNVLGIEKSAEYQSKIVVTLFLSTNFTVSTSVASVTFCKTTYKSSTVELLYLI